MRRLTFLLLLTATACNPITNLLKEEDRVSCNIVVNNQTGATLRDIRIYAIQYVGTAGKNIATDSLLLGDSDHATVKQGTFLERNIKPTDGDMEFQATTVNGSRLRRRFGYFTNGQFLVGRVNVIAQKDTILFK